MADNLLEVTTRDGKYTVIQAPHGGMTFKRHGEDWEAANRDFSGVGLILALAQDLEIANKVAVAAHEFLFEEEKRGELFESLSDALKEWQKGRTVKRTDKA
jgi:hypothetical protein